MRAHMLVLGTAPFLAAVIAYGCGARSTAPRIDAGYADADLAGTDTGGASDPRPPFFDSSSGDKTAADASLDASAATDARPPSDAPAPDQASDSRRPGDGVLMDAAGDRVADGTCARPLAFGVNIHDGTSNPAALADVMAARNIRAARMDLYGNDPAYVTRFKLAVTALSARQVKIEAIVYDDFSQGGRLHEACGGDLAAVEQSAYNQTISQIRATQTLGIDYEMQNEISLYDNIKKEGTTGQSAADYDVPCGLMQAANLRGMSRAIADVRASSGAPMRIILGTTDRSFGFLSFMESQNVQFDVVGYHIYPWRQHPPLDQDPWFGPGGPLGQLARFNRPIHINEFNCGEIYSGSNLYPNDPNYENQDGQPVTDACLKGLAKHLLEIANHTLANVESVHFYEALDESSKPVPENRFGLMYALDRPKVHLFLAAAFAGGALSTAERGELTTRALLTDAQITAWQPCGAR